MKIVFMGTPDFSVPCLESLVSAGHEVVGVFTQPDKPKGRGYTLTPPPVKVKAEELGFPVFQPKTLRDGTALDILKELSPDAIVVVAYGKLLPKEILELPQFGCINVHASLLPRHRGASPIQWAIVCGDTVTGVCTMKMDEGMDTGDVFERAEIPIDPNENCESLYDRLSLMGAKLIVSTLKGLEDGSVKSMPQSSEGVTKAPIIKKEMGLLDFSKTAKQLHDLVRGFDPWPSTYTFINGKRLKVLSAKADYSFQGNCGEVLVSEKRLLIGCAEGALELLTVQLEGKPRVEVSDFLKGRSIPVGTIIG